jgi:ATP-dependent Lon protease
MNELRFPLFPLGIVLLPGTRVPLHIFEERYKQMTRECLENDAPFVISYYDGDEPRRVACTARISKVINRYPDGRLDIVCLGADRVEIEEIIDEKSYLEARVQLLTDEPHNWTAEDREAAREAMTRYREVAEILNDKAEDLSGMSLEALSFRLAGTVGFTQKEKQKFLEMTSSPERLKRVTKALGRIIDRLRIAAHVQRIIGGNGHFPGLFEKREK